MSHESEIRLTEVDNGEFDCEPASVDDVVLPADVGKSDGVGVLVEEESDIDGQEHDGETLGTDRVRENLSGVAYEETRPGQVVEEVVDEDDSDNGLTSRVCLGGGVTTGGNSP